MVSPTGIRFSLQHNQQKTGKFDHTVSLHEQAICTECIYFSIHPPISQRKRKRILTSKWEKGRFFLSHSPFTPISQLYCEVSGLSIWHSCNQLWDVLSIRNSTRSWSVNGKKRKKKLHEMKVNIIIIIIITNLLLIGQCHIPWKLLIVSPF